MQQAIDAESLYAIGSKVLELFLRLGNVISGSSLEGSENETPPRVSFEAEADRFELWSVNLGLFVAGHGSLDYRLREAEGLRQTVKTFLLSLATALTNGKNTVLLSTMIPHLRHLGQGVISQPNA